jgi:hypothetical protein
MRLGRIRRNIVPQRDIDLQDSWQRFLTLGDDIAPVLAVLAAQSPTEPKMLTCDEAGRLLFAGALVSPLPIGTFGNLWDDQFVNENTPSALFDSLGAAYVTITGQVESNVQGRILAGNDPDHMIIIASPAVGPSFEVWYNAAAAFRYYAVQLDLERDPCTATALAKYG